MPVGRRFRAKTSRARLENDGFARNRHATPRAGWPAPGVGSASASGPVVSGFRGGGGLRGSSAGSPAVAPRSRCPMWIVDPRNRALARGGDGGLVENVVVVRLRRRLSAARPSELLRLLRRVAAGLPSSAWRGRRVPGRCSGALRAFDGSFRVGRGLFRRYEEILDMTRTRTRPTGSQSPFPNSGNSYPPCSSSSAPRRPSRMHSRASPKHGVRASDHDGGRSTAGRG